MLVQRLLSACSVISLMVRSVLSSMFRKVSCCVRLVDASLNQAMELRCKLGCHIFGGSRFCEMRRCGLRGGKLGYRLYSLSQCNLVRSRVSS